MNSNKDNQIKLAVDEGNISSRTPFAVCVDDEETNLEILELHLKKAGIECVTHAHSKIALEYIKNNAEKIDVIILDIMMPEMDGITLLKELKAFPKTKAIPVIMQTAMTDERKTVEGIEAGAYYYITKPYAHPVLISIIKSSLKDKKDADSLKTEVNSMYNVIDNVTSVTFEIKTFEEARKLANYVARFSADPNKYIVGLTSLLINSIEHGNLEVGFETKQKLLLENKYDQEINSRKINPAYSNKKVSIEVYRKDAEGIYTVVIKDEGKGFNWQDYIDFDPTRMADPSGRGIAMANIMSPGAVEYWGKGNMVVYKMPINGNDLKNSKEELKASNIS